MRQCLRLATPTTCHTRLADPVDEEAADLMHARKGDGQVLSALSTTSPECQASRILCRGWPEPELDTLAALLLGAFRKSSPVSPW